jgi:hypothetical protein
MPIGVLFWLLMLIWLISGIYSYRTDIFRGNYGIAGGNLLLFILLALIGWKLFGPMFQ